ncbi:MAG: thymidylate synthase, partial [Deltaproteobacteria bacterium]|nr:thymidylate synthase [Deltaproteobacteria bacterium]
MNIHRITARDLPDLWFQAIHDILDHGKRFNIDRGSYAGQTRLEYDYFFGHVLHPHSEPLLPDIPPSCGIPNPVEEAYIYGGEGYERSYIEYLMTGHKEPGESYTYGERLTRTPITRNK